MHAESQRRPTTADGRCLNAESNAFTSNAHLLLSDAECRTAARALPGSTSCLNIEEDEGDHSTGALSLLSRTAAGIALSELTLLAIRCSIAKRCPHQCQYAVMLGGGGFHLSEVSM